MDNAQFFSASKARTERGLTILDIDLSAAVDQVVNIPGKLLYLDKQSTGICYVEGSVDQGTMLNPLLASPGFRMSNEFGFSGFRLTAPAQAGKMIRLVIATGMTISPGDPVQSGAVATPTIDAALARTVAGVAFMGFSGQGAVAGEYSGVQLFNPAASPKTIIVESLIVGSATAGLLGIGHKTAALPGLIGAWKSKKSGAVDGNGLVYIDTDPAVASLFTTQIAQVYCLASQSQYLRLVEPIAVLPGYGFSVFHSTANADLRVTFEGYEQ